MLIERSLRHRCNKMFVLFNNRNKSARRPQTTMAGATGDDAERIPGHSAG